MRRFEPAPPRFDRPVILKQPAAWSRAILWSIVGVTVAVGLWAAFAEVEEAVEARGKLEPLSLVKDVQPPVGGVVSEIHVAEGQRVRKGQVLISLVPTVSRSQIEALGRVRTSLEQESRFYRTQLGTDTTGGGRSGPPEAVRPLTRNRAALLAEIALARAELGETSALDPEQRRQLAAGERERTSRFAAVRSNVDQLERQLAQVEAKLASARQVLAINRKILIDIGPLAEQGAMARVQYLRQRQEVSSGTGEVERLGEEGRRLKLAVAQAREQFANSKATFEKERLDKIAANRRLIAEIDSRLAKLVVENDKRASETASQLDQARLTLQYQQLRSPVDGTVFDLRPHSPGFVVEPGSPVLKIVPGGDLLARVHITNRDIGFVREGMAADVRIDSFPFTEFGDIAGQLLWLGSDALPPTEERPFYSFPAKVRLSAQTLAVRGRTVPLQSGMAVSANLRVRKRTVLSVFTDLFARPFDNLKFVR
ncbi:MAG: HlyD family efflux transporter periplasmic adaptor subunit [Aphanocapsa lilacina HA4352-LM1]|nr:HlyD family efflux transporter periplasmic adaptor subunit [Aphanocapsa lilacina HA4352-LM1]